MATAATLRALPGSLAVLFVICVAAPVWSLIALGSPAEVWRDQGAWAAALLIISYWIMPPAMAIAIVTRSVVFLPFFVSECAALLLYVSVYGAASADVLQWGRYAIIGLTALAGVFISSKDLIAPFLHFGSPEWRRTPRLPSNIKMRASVGNRVPVEVVVDDFSLAGMAISLHAEDVGKAHGLRRGDKLAVLGLNDKVPAVGCEIAWVKVDGPLVSVGLKVLDPAAMATMVQAFRGQRRGLVLPFWLGRLWLNRGFRRLMMAVWACLILAAFGSPAFAPRETAVKNYSGATPPPPAPSAGEE